MKTKRRSKKANGAQNFAGMATAIHSGRVFTPVHSYRLTPHGARLLIEKYSPKTAVAKDGATGDIKALKRVWQILKTHHNPELANYALVLKELTAKHTQRNGKKKHKKSYPLFSYNTARGALQEIEGTLMNLKDPRRFPKKEMAEKLGMKPPTICREVRILRKSHKLKPGKAGGPVKFISQEAEEKLQEIIQKTPAGGTIYFDEVIKKVTCETGALFLISLLKTRAKQSGRKITVHGGTIPSYCENNLPLLKQYLERQRWFNLEPGIKLKPTGALKPQIKQ